ncbi:MAG TPA: hypothetical protein VHK06_00750, partial [Candidatus Limnocylindria bacterium]|nr:hypothetical protein [Candidatus Limnocylindria bacterium]
MRGRPAGRSSPDPAGEPAARLAAAIERRGLAAPAALILDAHRPLVPLLGAAAAFVRPLLGPLGAGTPRDAIELVEDPDGL